MFALALVSAACGKSTPSVALEDIASLATGQRPTDAQAAAEILSKVPFHSDPKLNDLLEAEVKTVKASDEVYAYSLEDKRVRTKHYCRHECACIAQKLAQKVAKAYPEYSVMNVHTRGEFGVNVYAGPKRTPVFFMYHASTVIRDASGSWSFVDLFLFGDATPRPFAEWWSRFAQPDKYIFKIYPVH